MWAYQKESDVGFPSVCGEYVLLPDRLFWPSYDMSKYSKEGTQSRDRGGKKAVRHMP